MSKRAYHFQVSHNKTIFFLFEKCMKSVSEAGAYKKSAKVVVFRCIVKIRSENNVDDQYELISISNYSKFIRLQCDLAQILGCAHLL